MYDGLDGVYTMECNQPRFHRVNAPDRQLLEKLLNRIIGRVMRRLVKDGLLIPDQNQPWFDLPDTGTLDALNAASIRYRVAIGPGAGGKDTHLEEPGFAAYGDPTKTFHGRQRWFFTERGCCLPAAPARSS
jgi:hypothetical protein